MSESKEDIGNSIKKSSLAALLTAVFLDNLGFAILLPYLYYYVTFLGGSVFDYGLLLATYSLMSFIFTPLISRLSDRYGRRRILLSAVMISSISYFVVGIGQFLWILFLGRMLAGTTAATYPISQAYMVDVTSKESRLRYIGYLGASAGIAFIIGPLIGGTLSSIAGFNIPAFLAATLATTNLILTFLFLPEPTVSHSDLSARAVTIKALRKVLQKRSIQMLLGTYFLFFLAFMFLQTTLTPWLEGIFGFSEFETGLVFFYVGLMVAFAQVVLLPRLSTKLNKMELTIYGWLMLFGGFLTIGVFGSLYLFLVIVGLIAVGSGLMLVTIVTLISLNTPREAQGGTLGLAQSLSGLAQTIAPTIAATIFSFSTTINITGLVFIAAAIISACIAPLILKLKNQPDSNTFAK